MSLDRAARLRLAELAGRAPSPHNIQPARWRFVEGPQGVKIELHECTGRWLQVGDPRAHDNQVALGAAWEGMSLALSLQGLALDEMQLHDGSAVPSASSPHRLIATANVTTRSRLDELAGHMEQRRSFRGIFPPANHEQLAKLSTLAATSDFALAIPDKALIDRIAAWYDEAAAHSMRNPLFVRELYGWMRFSTSDPDWRRDGLSTDCMELSAFEAFAARFALQPAVVRGLCALKLESLLTAESAKVKSATTLMVLHAASGELPFETGRRFYRFWLELTRAGFCGVPMSALSDSPDHAAKLLAAFPLPPGRRLVNVMRVGPRPQKEIARSARLPTEELLLS